MLTKHFSCRCVAVFSDIHSNYHALRACFEDALAQGAEGFIFLGDYVSDLAEPLETLDLVYEIMASYPTACLRGNRERYMLEHRAGQNIFRPGSKTGSLLFTYRLLRERDLRFFESLPIWDTVTFSGLTLEIAHAARDDDRFYFEDDSQNIQTVFSRMEVPCLLTGHCHKQYLARCQEKTIINPGSVGIPQGGGRWPQYALLTVENGALQCRFRQVPYPLEPVIHAQFESGLTDVAGCWTVSILYDLITGEERTPELLDRVSHTGSVHNEENWRRAAKEMGMGFTENEIRDFLSKNT